MSQREKDEQHMALIVQPGHRYILYYSNLARDDDDILNKGVLVGKKKEVSLRIIYEKNLQDMVNGRGGRVWGGQDDLQDFAIFVRLGGLLVTLIQGTGEEKM